MKNVREAKKYELTRDQANLISVYIHLTYSHRKNDREMWERLAQETNADGTPKYENAANNAKWYGDLEGRLADIINILDYYS